MSGLEVAVRLDLDRFNLDVDLTIHQGVTGIFGASGAGKSSLLETVAGLRRSATGRIALDGEEWLDTSSRLFVVPEKRDVGYVPQEGLLFPHWDVRGNLLAGRERARRSGQEPEATLERVVDLLELGTLLGRATPTLSGGERQRVALGRALCSGARLLLLDEPLAALDLPLRRRLLPFLRRIRDELTMPMLLVSHDPTEVQALCDDLVVLSRGSVIARGAPRRVLTDPEVFSLAEHQGFENVLAGRVTHSDRRGCRVRLGDSTVELALLRTGRTGTDVLVGLPASEIMLATERPRGISARNVLEASIREVRSLEQHTLVMAELAPGLPALTVEVAEATPAELGLEPGSRVYLVIKAASCRLYAAVGPSDGGSATQP